MRIPPVEDFLNGINDVTLPWWHGISPAQIKYEVVEAADAADSRAESLPEALVQAILTVRPRTLVRATHRRQHLDEIERALGHRGRI